MKTLILNKLLFSSLMVAFVSGLSFSAYAEDGSTYRRFGLGYSTLSTGLPNQGGSITGIWNMTSVDTVHGFFSIPGSSPFNIGGLFLYKRTLVKRGGAGFHVGVGLGFANVNGWNAYIGDTFHLKVAGVIGFHFEFPNVPSIQIHLDGGPLYTFYNSMPTNEHNFQLSSFNPALGASVVFMF